MTANPMTYTTLLQQVARGLMVRSDSRKIEAGDVFVALPGMHVDGVQFVPQAIEQGAKIIVSKEKCLPKGSSATLVLHPCPRQALSELASAYFKTSKKPLTCIGVTGTNGKTTVTTMVEHMLSLAGRKVGVIGTVAYYWPGHRETASMTTPDPWELHKLIATMQEHGVDTVVMEVSSHALEQKRVMGLSFDIAVMCNLTQDHLDLHHSMEAYFKAKARLFTEVGKKDKTSILNLDDPWALQLFSQVERPLGFGLEPRAGEYAGTLTGNIKKCSLNGLVLDMQYKGESWTLTSPLIGRHNASNLLAAQAVILALGMTPKHCEALADFKGVPGRLERIENNKGFHIFIDYAHTPHALESVLSAVGQLGVRRLFCVFGCGGDRDKGKRPLMGEAVCRHAHVAVLTSDNPRSEDPVAIMEDVIPGLLACTEVIKNPNRGEAIALALTAMQAGDVLIVAGKGHEDYQEIMGKKETFNDAQVVREFLCSI